MAIQYTLVTGGEDLPVVESWQIDKGGYLIVGTIGTVRQLLGVVSNRTAVRNLWRRAIGTGLLLYWQPDKQSEPTVRPTYIITGMKLPIRIA